MTDQLDGRIVSIADGEKTVHERRTVWGTDGLPEELSHEDIAFYRYMAGPGPDAYQIGFEQTFTPFGYRTPDDYEIISARMEYHDRPSDGFLRRIFSAGREFIVVVLQEQNTGYWEI